MPSIKYGNTTFDPDSGVVSTPEGATKIRGRQAVRLLERLLLRRGKLVTTETLLDVVWDMRPDGPEGPVIKVLIHAVRDALTTVKSDWSLTWQWRRGYTLNVPDTAQQHTVVYSDEQYKALHRALRIVEQKDPLLAAMIRGE